MAFASMFLMFLMICIGVLGLTALLGVLLIIVSCVRRSRARANGQQPKKAGLIAGILLTVVPGALVALCGALLAHGSGGSSYKKARELRDVLEAGLTAGDSAQILSAFSETAKAECPGLSGEIGDLLERIGGSVGSYEQQLPKESAEAYAENGAITVMRFEGELENAAAADGKTYRIRYFGYSRDESHPERVGLERITVTGGETELVIGISP